MDRLRHHRSARSIQTVERISRTRSLHSALCIVDPAVRFTLACESIEAADSRTLRESIRRVITTAREFAQINRVYCDRGFYRVPLVETLADLDVEFVVRLSEFLFAVALYNLWILVCLVLVDQRELPDRPAVSTALFRQFVLALPDG